MQIEIEDKVFKLRNLGFSIKPFLKRFEIKLFLKRFAAKQFFEKAWVRNVYLILIPLCRHRLLTLILKLLNLIE